MIEKFFHDLNKTKVAYLLISGQATIRYGAATFSEDIDIWVEPTTDNWNKFLQVLNNQKATIYKLTPPISMTFIQKGHGFHFRLIDKGNKLPFCFLDVMGIAPRVENFQICYQRAKKMKTEWGILPVVGIRDLVDIKKTRRLEDYPVISNLVRNEYQRLLLEKINPADWEWILNNSFEVQDLLYFLKTHSDSHKIAKTSTKSCLPYCLKAISLPNQEHEFIETISKNIALEIEDIRQQDRVYWKSVINDIRQLNKKRQLLSEGSKPPNVLQ